MKKFEYLVKYDCSQKELDECGFECWELISFAQKMISTTYLQAGSMVFIFKRELVFEHTK